MERVGTVSGTKVEAPLAEIDSGVFTTSLTISGTPVATGTSFVPEDYVANAGGTLTVSGTGAETDGVGVDGNLTVTGTVVADGGVLATESSVVTISGHLQSEIDVFSTLAAVTIEAPSDEEDFSIMKVSEDTTLTKMYSVIQGAGSPSVTWTIRHDWNRNATGTEVVVGGTQTTSLTGGDTVTAMDNATITGSSWVWLETTVTGGSPQELVVELFI